MFLSVALVAFTLTAPPEQPKPFEFKDGDRIVWLGSTLVEREQRYGYWETALLAANPDKKITVRNLGWSGDTVFGEARGRFDFANADKCFKQIVDQTLELKPTVIFICYGTNESFEGKEGLPKFEKGLEKLLDALKPTKARIVLFSPLPVLHTQLAGDPEPVPVPANRHDDLKAYAAAIQKVAEGRKLTFAPLYEMVVGQWIKCSIDERCLQGPALSKLTTNGMHLTELGYEMMAPAFLRSLGISVERIPWEKYSDKFEPLRQAIVAKNEQFFNKWRPQNETYLTGFRKAEQGRNAKEIAEFDPFIAKAEDEIDTLRKALKK